MCNRPWQSLAAACVLVARLAAAPGAATATTSTTLTVRDPARVGGVADRLPRPPHPLDAAVRPTVAEAMLVADASDGGLDRCDLLWAALIAGGTNDVDTLNACRRRWEETRTLLHSAAVPVGSPRQSAAALLAWLHQRVLTGGYDARCSDLAATLREGRYNCVTSAVLFHMLAADVGLPTAFVECRGHVLVDVLGPDGPIAVETTCPTWLDGAAGRPPEAAPAATGAPAVPRPGSAETHRRTISETGLVAIAFYNRGVDCLEAGDPAGAVGANWLALQCDPASDAARTNLLAAVNDWALAQAAQGELDTAQELLSAGLQLAPSHGPLLKNQDAVRRMQP
jgi:hypothetical protein